MRLLGVMLGCLVVLSASRSDALAECDFTFDVSRESSALQSLIDGAQERGGFWRPIREAPDDVRDIGRFIGRLDICLVTPDGKPRTIRIGGGSQELASPYVTTCTAALLPGNRLLANRHCFYEPLLVQAGFSFVQEARINFGYVSEDFTDDVKTFHVSTREVAQDEDTDALVLQIVGADANQSVGGHFPMVMETRATPRRALTMIHHPLRQPQRFSSGTCQIHPTQAELPDGVAKLRHTCETGGGSSGALLLDARTLAVVGLHNRGGLSARGGHNGGHKIAAVEAALSLGFKEQGRPTPKQDPEADAQVALILALAMETATAKASALRDVEAGFPGTRASDVARRELSDLREDLGASQLDEAQAVVDPVRRLQAVEAIGQEFPGTRAARQAKRLLALMTPVVDPERQAQAALSDALGLTDADTRKAALEQVVARFPDSSSAASAGIALGLFAPKPVSPEAQATEALTRALQLDADARRSALKEIGSAFSGTAAARSAEAMLALMQPAPAQPATDNLSAAADPPTVPVFDGETLRFDGMVISGPDNAEVISVTLDHVFQRGDTILAASGKRVDGVADLAAALRSAARNGASKIPVSGVRRGSLYTVSMQVPGDLSLPTAQTPVAISPDDISKAEDSAKNPWLQFDGKMLQVGSLQFRGTTSIKVTGTGGARDLQPGDEILRAAGRGVRSTTEFFAVISEQQAQGRTSIQIQILSGGHFKTVVLRLEADAPKLSQSDLAELAFDRAMSLTDETAKRRELKNIAKTYSGTAAARKSVAEIAGSTTRVEPQAPAKPIVAAPVASGSAGVTGYTAIQSVTRPTSITTDPPVTQPVVKKRTAAVTFPPPPQSALGEQAEVLGMEMSTLTPGLRRHYGLSDKDKGVVVVGVKSGSIAAKNGIVAGALITGASYRNVDHPDQVVAVEDNTRRQGRQALPIYFTFEGKENVVRLPMKR
jgi:S1-C subfamily serine protease